MVINGISKRISYPLQLIGEDEKESAFFEKFLAKELGCCEKDILSFDLSAYPTEDGCTFGLHDDFVSSPRLDNLTSCKACLEGIVNGKAEEGVALIGLFDNEEVGSTTKQGPIPLSFIIPCTVSINS